MLKYIFIIYIIWLASLSAETLSLESGINQTTLVELYTSEGCSSCPPAEDYLNKLKNNPNLWKKWVPVAFHVNYWDYIGWRDRYARSEFGQRQSRYAKLKRASTVYTPAFMVNGSSWRRGIFSSSLPETAAPVGKLMVSVSEKSVVAEFKPLKKYKTKLKLNIALLGMDLTNYIERGENKGRTAKHEFVVVGFNSEKSKNLKWKMTLPELHYPQVKKYALAAWVSEKGNPTPLQVVGGFFPAYKK